jgi:hypothetical protein
MAYGTIVSMRRSIALVLVLGISAGAVSLAFVPAAGAHRKPSKSEATGIDRAAHHSSATRGVGCFHTREIVVSTAGPWARALLRPCKPTFDTALAVFQRRHGKWTLRDVGTSGVGCTVVPRAVRHDLRLSCP